MKKVLSAIVALLTFTTTVYAEQTNTAIREVIFDVETTGLDINNSDRIIEIGAVELINKVKTGRTFHKYINPEFDFPKNEAHNLTNEFLINKPTFDKIAQEFIDFVGEDVLIAHNAIKFDAIILNKELKNAGYPEYKAERFIDTLPIARKIFPSVGNQCHPNSLDALIERFGFDNSKRKEQGHGALLDAELLADVYIKMSEYTDKPSIDVVKNTINKAIKNNKKLKITYFSNPCYKNELTTRTINPQKIGLGKELNDKKSNKSKFKLKNNELYLKAFCELENAERRFLVERILKIDVIN